MTAFDYTVLVLIALSVLLSVMRGLVREVLALAAWIVAFLAANLLAEDLAALMPAAIQGAELRLLAGFVSAFFVVLLLMSLVSLAASQLMKHSGLGVEDRALGAVFGLARGMLVVMVLVLLAGLTSLPRKEVWRNAALSQPLEALAHEVKVWLPAGLSRKIVYD
jgi:membrane protein required for colicin V production